MLTRRGTLLGVAVPLLLTDPAFGQTPVLSKGLASLSRLLGGWKGEGDGEPGHSTVERSYEIASGGNFIVVRNTSTYAPQPKNPNGEVHTDVGWISYDRAARTVVLRQFHLSEAFVNTYNAAEAGLVGDVWVFESVGIENIPPGYKARETYAFAGAAGLEEKFEIAEPGKAYEVYSLNRLRRS